MHCFSFTLKPKGCIFFPLFQPKIRHNSVFNKNLEAISTAQLIRNRNIIKRSQLRRGLIALLLLSNFTNSCCHLRLRPHATSEHVVIQMPTASYHSKLSGRGESANLEISPDLWMSTGEICRLGDIP